MSNKELNSMLNKLQAMSKALEEDDYSTFLFWFSSLTFLDPPTSNTSGIGLEMGPYTQLDESKVIGGFMDESYLCFRMEEIGEMRFWMKRKDLLLEK